MQTDFMIIMYYILRTSLKKPNTNFQTEQGIGSLSFYQVT